MKAVRVFLEVAAQKSFAGAARELRLTPASVTRIIAKLEEDLGQQLLLRTTRQVSLTSAGALVATRYRPVVEDFDRVTLDLTRARMPDRGRLAINAPMSFGLRLMPKLIDSFRLAYPNIALDVKLTDTLVDIIEEDCDLAIRVSRAPTDKSTIWRKICQVPRGLVAAPSLLERIDRPNSPDELNQAHCLSYSESKSPEHWEFSNGPARRRVRAGDGLISNNGDFLYAIAAAGGGIVMLPEFIYSEGLSTGAVVRLLEDWEIEPLWLTLYYPPYEQLPPLVETFTDFFEAFIRDADGLTFEQG